MKLLSTREAADILGISVLRVQQLIWDGRLPAQRIGRTYVINEEDLKLVVNRKTGRPPKPKEEKGKGSNKKGGKKS
jgi:excisionase family DNA binding protein